MTATVRQLRVQAPPCQLDETYELRTSKGARVYAYDSLARAQSERAAMQQKFNRPLELWIVRRSEQRIG